MNSTLRQEVSKHGYRFLSVPSSNYERGRGWGCVWSIMIITLSHLVKQELLSMPTLADYLRSTVDQTTMLRSSNYSLFCKAQVAMACPTFQSY